MLTPSLTYEAPPASLIESLHRTRCFYSNSDLFYPLSWHTRVHQEKKLLNMGKPVPLSYGVPRPSDPWSTFNPSAAIPFCKTAFCCSLQGFAYKLLVHRQCQHTLITVQNPKKRKWHWTRALMFRVAPMVMGQRPAYATATGVQGTHFSMAVCSGKLKREPWVWARTWSRAKTVSSLALVFMPFSHLGV